MKSSFVYQLLLLLSCSLISCQRAIQSSDASNRFDISQDLLLLHYDCKTDVDDLHSIAAFASVIDRPDLQGLQYHAVAGTYGIQGGLYVPPEELMPLAFGDRWSDAHADFDQAVANVKLIAMETLSTGGDVWIAEAGQSDFSAALVKAIKAASSKIKPTDRIHIVQHSNWNEESTDPAALAYVQAETDYHKIPDGNAEANGTPGYRDPDFADWHRYVTQPKKILLWNTANRLSKAYNGVDGRYLNEAMDQGGMDFSDFSEVQYILQIDGIETVTEYFESLP